jgi:hypothetical protein
MTDDAFEDVWAMLEQLPQDDARTLELANLLADFELGYLEIEYKLRRVLGDEHVDAALRETLN